VVRDRSFAREPRVNVFAAHVQLRSEHLDPTHDLSSVTHGTGLYDRHVVLPRAHTLLSFVTEINR